MGLLSFGVAPVLKLKALGRMFVINRTAFHVVLGYKASNDLDDE